MISNEKVREIFGQIVDLPDVVAGFKRASERGNNNYRCDSRISLQIIRGEPARNWVGAPKGSCAECKACFNDFDVIPKYCFDCYKVVIELNKIVDLFRLNILFDNIKLPRNNSRKCMLDMRKHTTGSYKGFVYCRGLDEADALCKVLQDEVTEAISPDVTVSVKRGCSEYALKYPEYAEINRDSDGFQYPDNWKFYEDYVERCWVFSDKVDSFDEDGLGIDPMREVLAYQWWLKFAASKGDESYLIVTGNKVIEPFSQSR